MDYKKLLGWFLWLVCAHSIGVGLGLIIMPSDWLAFFDLTVDPYRFFSTQGGVFHLVMAVAYGLAASKPERYPGLLILIVSAKIIAFLFLSIYYLAVEMILTVALSGVVDGMMAILIMFLYMKGFTEVQKVEDRRQKTEVSSQEQEEGSTAPGSDEGGLDVTAL